MKQRVIDFAKRIGSKMYTYDTINQEELIHELGDFFFPSGDRDGLLVEEVTEMQDALKANDIIEVLDAYLDLQVYLHQIGAWLDKAGVDVRWAADAVCDNNDSKYTTSHELVIEWLVEHVKDGKDYYIDTNYVDGEYYYCLKDSTGKVKKPKDFVAVDLREFIPKHLLED